MIISKSTHIRKPNLRDFNAFIFKGSATSAKENSSLSLARSCHLIIFPSMLRVSFYHRCFTIWFRSVKIPLVLTYRVCIYIYLRKKNLKWETCSHSSENESNASREKSHRRNFRLYIYQDLYIYIHINMCNIPIWRYELSCGCICSKAFFCAKYAIYVLVK